MHPCMYITIKIYDCAVNMRQELEWVQKQGMQRDGKMDYMG